MTVAITSPTVEISSAGSGTPRSVTLPRNFGADVAENHKTHCHPDAGPALREEVAALEVHQLRPRRARHESHDDDGAEYDECQDGDHLDHGKPILKLAKISDSGSVDAEQ